MEKITAKNGVEIAIELQSVRPILTLEYLRNYLRINNEEDDQFLMHATETALNCAAKITGIKLGEKEYKADFYFKEDGVLNIDIGCLSSDDEPLCIERVIDKTEIYNYRVKNGILYFENKVSSPLTVYFSKGNVVTEEIKQAMLFHIADIYQNKDGNCQIPPASKEIYNLYRKIHI